jgi:hypothetical protein
MHPYLIPDMDEYFKRELIDEGTERIPAGEIGIHRGASIYATDGKIGVVDEFLISPADNHITLSYSKKGISLEKSLSPSRFRKLTGLKQMVSI